KSSARVSHTSHRTRCFITRLPTGSSLVPYTTLFRSWQNLVLVGIGAAWTVTAAGRERFQRVSQSWRSVLDGAVHVVDETVGRRGGGQEAAPGPGPVLIGGFACDAGSAAGAWAPCGGARLALARVTYGR